MRQLGQVCTATRLKHSRLWVLIALARVPEELSAVRLYLSWVIFECEDLGKCWALRKDNAHASQPDTCAF